MFHYARRGKSMIFPRLSSGAFIEQHGQKMTANSSLSGKHELLTDPD
jgi:hypothetical protein